MYFKGHHQATAPAAEKARMAATAKMPDQRWTQPAQAAARSGGGRPAVRWRKVEEATSARNRADEGGIKRELRPVPMGQAVRDDLNAPRVTDGDIDVHVNDPDVACNSCATLPTDAGDGMLEHNLAVATQRVEAASATAKRVAFGGAAIDQDRSY